MNGWVRPWTRRVLGASLDATGIERLVSPGSVCCVCVLSQLGTRDLHGPPSPAREWARLLAAENYYRAESGQRVQDHKIPKIYATIYVYK
uniref:Uncharacterized protein n=1 Tax=Romanomermis culicivorax TaxID=13658 RepID=A0A915K2S2_ROMCU